MVLATVTAGCGGSGSSGSSDADGPHPISFHGELPVLPNFTKKTGLQPKDAPVQLELAFSAGGSLTADAQAVAGGSGDSLAVAAVPGSGLFKLDAHVKLVGTLHVAVATFHYDGPIPGIDNIDVAFGAQAAFDPFLIGAMAHVSASIPETRLPPIPLPGGIPGELRITIVDGSVLTSDLSGTCAGLEASKVQFLANTTTGGTLVLKPEIVIKLPVVGDKTFPIPPVTVTIPSVGAPIDLGTQGVTGGGDQPRGTSLASRGMCSPGGGGGGSDAGVDAAVDAAASSHALVDKQTGRCLDSDVNGLPSVPNAALTVPCDGSAHQQWRREPTERGFVRFVNVQTALCLDSNDAGSAYVTGCNRGNYQNWLPGPGPDVTFKDAQTDRCLDSNEAGQVYTLGCNGGDYQVWQEP